MGVRSIEITLFAKLPPRYEDEMPCMKMYKPAECYAAVSFTLLRFNGVQNYSQLRVLQEAEAASEAPAEDDSLGDGDDWGSDDGDDGWGDDDDDDWKRKKRSVEESPSERWTRETHEVKIMEC